MRILHIGDIVGKPGRDFVVRSLGQLREQFDLDLVIANAENIAGGSGITPASYQELRRNGVDCVTLGDHIYRRREIYSVLEADEPIVKPANYPATAPGKTWTLAKSESGVEIAVFSLIGRVFMKPVDCPYAAADQVLSEIPDRVKIRWLDFHAEATSDKQLMGRFLDGRVTAVLGTHTHVPTADGQVLPGGTAFQCDLGMSGPHDSILGRRVDRVLETTTSFRPTSFDVASKDLRINGAIVTVDAVSGKALELERVTWTEKDFS